MMKHSNGRTRHGKPSPEAFRFVALLDRLLGVPKAEIDAERRKYERRKYER